MYISNNSLHRLLESLPLPLLPLTRYKFNSLIQLKFIQLRQVKLPLYLRKRRCVTAIYNQISMSTIRPLPRQRAFTAPNLHFLTLTLTRTSGSVGVEQPSLHSFSASSIRTLLPRCPLQVIMHWSLYTILPLVESGSLYESSPAYKSVSGLILDVSGVVGVTSKKRKLATLFRN